MQATASVYMESSAARIEISQPLWKLVKFSSRRLDETTEDDSKGDRVYVPGQEMRERSCRPEGGMIQGANAGLLAIGHDDRGARTPCQMG